MLDSVDVNEVESRVEFVAVCRNYAGELAISEVTLRTYSDLAQYSETETRILLDALRHAVDADRPFRQSQVDAAIPFLPGGVWGRICGPSGQGGRGGSAGQCRREKAGTCVTRRNRRRAQACILGWVAVLNCRA